jgi:hypothetical protein
VRRELSERGAPDAALSRVDGLVSGAHTRGTALYVVADAARCWIAESWIDAPDQELARWAPLPSFAPLLAQRQVEIPHVVALVDREGADLLTATSGATRDATVTGETGPVIRRSAPGGWSQQRYQQRAEDAWSRTAREIAHALVASVDDVRAQIVVIAGDVRAVQLVTDELPARVRELVQIVAGGRAPGTDDEALAEDVARFVRTAAAESSVALLQKLREEVGQEDRAVAGAEPTLAALREARVEVLLVHDRGNDDRSAWFGPAPLSIGLERGDAELDGRPAREGRLIDVAVRGAIGGGAEIRVVPNVAQVRDGLAGILRWAG